MRREMMMGMCCQLQQQCGRELCIVVTNLSRMCSEYCTTRTCPDLPVRAAVRMSMAFPGIDASLLLCTNKITTTTPV